MTAQSSGMTQRDEKRAGEWAKVMAWVFKGSCHILEARRDSNRPRGVSGPGGGGGGGGGLSAGRWSWKNTMEVCEDRVAT